jgi:hypothetical protein
MRAAISRALRAPVRRDHVVDQPELARALRGQVLAADQHLRGDRITDLAAQPHGRARHREETALHLRDAEHGALARDADVGSLEDLRPPRTREALRGEDHRLGRAIGLEPRAIDQAGLLHRAFHVFVLGQALPHLADLGEIHARAERGALAGEDRDAQVVVLVELFQAS